VHIEFERCPQTETVNTRSNDAHYKIWAFAGRYITSPFDGSPYTIRSGGGNVFELLSTDFNGLIGLSTGGRVVVLDEPNAE
jgi:hypothetical protein